MSENETVDACVNFYVKEHDTTEQEIVEFGKDDIPSDASPTEYAVVLAAEKSEFTHAETKSIHIT